jgi:hypothetical protein
MLTYLADEALKLTGDVMNFSEPNRRTLKATRALFNGKAGTMLLGAGVEKRLRDKNDLCVLRAPPEPDRLTSLFEGRLASLFRASDSQAPSRLFTLLISISRRNQTV